MQLVAKENALQHTKKKKNKQTKQNKKTNTVECEPTFRFQNNL